MTHVLQLTMLAVLTENKHWVNEENIVERGYCVHGVVFN